MVKRFQSLHFIDQRVIIFHPYYSSYLQTKIWASEAHILNSFQIDLKAIFHLK